MTLRWLLDETCVLRGGGGYQFSAGRAFPAHTKSILNIRSIINYRYHTLA